jgi:hypothetical protein
LQIYNNQSKMSTDNIENRVENNEQMVKELETRELETRDTRETSDYDISIFRFKFTEEFMEELYKFSKIHQYDERKDFKEAWNIWVDENTETIDSEMHRLIVLGYEGDILTKMFKSARYYFRKKSPVPVEPKQRRAYITVQRDLLEAMDSHVKTNIGLNEYQPKTGFVSFCKENEAILKQTIANILQQGVANSEMIQDKLKKTYKNRYFIICNNNK